MEKTYDPFPFYLVLIRYSKSMTSAIFHISRKVKILLSTDLQIERLGLLTHNQFNIWNYYPRSFACT